MSLGLETQPILPEPRTAFPLSVAGRRIIMQGAIALGMVASGVYFGWWFIDGRLSHPIPATVLVLAALYTTMQIYFAWYVYAAIEPAEVPPPPPGVSVDVFVPVYDEAYELVETSLRAALAMRYPHRTYLLDDARDPRFAELAAGLGIGYLTREGTRHAKAGNVNAALARSSGEFVTVFDVDHIPARDFLDVVLGAFDDPKVAFVQGGVAFYNRDDSLVSRATIEQAYDIYGPTSMGMHGCNAAPVWGSHTTFRRAALDNIGGYQPGLAEDLHTSLRLHAGGWRSVFVPNVHAAGLVPSDFRAFTMQQRKWSRGVFGVLLELYPRVWPQLTWSQRIAYLVRSRFYLIGPVFAAHAFFAVYVLLLGTDAALDGFGSYLRAPCRWVSPSWSCARSRIALERAGRCGRPQVAWLHARLRTLADRHRDIHARRAAHPAAAHRDAEAAHGGGASAPRRRPAGADLAIAIGIVTRLGDHRRRRSRSTWRSRRGDRDPRVRGRGGDAPVTDEPASNDRVRPFAALRLLRPVLSAHPFAVVLVVLLGMLASAAEGIGITLFIPLVEGVDPGAAAGGLPAPLASLVGAVPADRRVVVLPLLMLGAIALKNVLVFANHGVVSRMFADIGADLRARLFDRLLTMRWESFERADAGTLLTLLATESWRAAQAVQLALTMLVQLCTIVVFVVLLLADLVAAHDGARGGTRRGVLAGSRDGGGAKRTGSASVGANARLGERMWETLAGMRTVHAFDAEDHERARFAAASGEVRRTFLRLDLLTGLVGPMAETLHVGLVLGIVVLALGDRGMLPGAGRLRGARVSPPAAAPLGGDRPGGARRPARRGP